MRPSARRSDDADVIRARLRAVLAEMGRQPGWVPPEDLLDDGAGDVTDDLSDDGRRDARRAFDHADESDRPDGDRPDHRAPAPAADGDTGLPVGLGRHRAPGAAARLDPGPAGARALWVAALLAAVLVVGWTWVDRPEVEEAPIGVIEATEAPSAGPPAQVQPSASGPAPPTAGGVLVVSVVGQVARPGLVTLPVGSRVADALAAAGGLLPEADPAALNAAALLTDGQQIAVGIPGAPPPAPGGTAAAGGAATGLLDLNTATVADLDALPGIGPVLAQRIVDHRSAQGPFTSVEQLDDVSGIGPAIYAELTDRVTV